MIEQQIRTLIEPAMTEAGFDVVRIMIMGDRNKVLQIMLDKLDGNLITIDECSAASRTISVLLDVNDPLEGQYVLEVSSPGIDRPLTRLKDFERFSGHKAKVELKEKINERRRFQGCLHGIKDDMIQIEVEGEMLSLSFDDILKSKLIMTDELIKALSEGTKL